MKIFNAVWWVSKAKVVLFIMIAVLIATLSLFFDGAQGNKMTALFGGFSTGLFLVIIQFMFSWGEHKERDKLRLLGLKKVLKNKKDRAYYGKLIGGAKRSVDLMGKTGCHFLEDFANTGGSDKEAKVLLKALGEGVRVRFLLPETAKGPKNEDTTQHIEILNSEYKNFSCRYFPAPECHSIFVADDDVIIGPFFPGARSMNTPALHVRRDATLSKCYLDYFDEVWDKCAPES